MKKGEGEKETEKETETANNARGWNECKTSEARVAGRVGLITHKLEKPHPS